MSRLREVVQRYGQDPALGIGKQVGLGVEYLAEQGTTVLTAHQGLTQHGRHAALGAIADQPDGVQRMFPFRETRL